MSAVVASPAVPATPKKAPASAKKAVGAKVAKPKSKPTHPPTSDMVNKAIAALKEKNGSSLQAIKKYIGANYTVEVEKLAPFIKKYLVSAVEGKKLVRTKGKGAAGSFKISASTEKKPASKKPAAKKLSAKKSPAKKVVKKASTKSAIKKVPAKSPKEKKATKSPAAKKPKAPKAKKVGAKKSAK